MSGRRRETYTVELSGGEEVARTNFCTKMFSYDRDLANRIILNSANKNK